MKQRVTRLAIASLCLLSLAILSSCVSSEPRLATILGHVLDIEGNPVPNAEVMVQGAENSSPVRTDSNGEFRLRLNYESDRVSLAVNADGFIRTAKTTAAQFGNTAYRPIYLMRRAEPSNLNVQRGGQVNFTQMDGFGVRIPPNSIVDSQGQIIDGDVRVYLTYIDVYDQQQIRTAPGDFRAVEPDHSETQLTSYGIFEIFIEDGNGDEADFLEGTSALINLPIVEAAWNLAPEVIGLYSFDLKRGYWVLESRLTRTNPVTYSGTISRTDTGWNADDPLDTTCRKVLVTRDFNNTGGTGPPLGPVAGVQVDATGVNYGSVSSGTTNSDGLVCLLVKINSDVEIVVHQWWGNPAGPVSFGIKTSPNQATGANDCNDDVLCPVITTAAIDW